MSGTAEKALAALGITLPSPTSPVANYVGVVRSGNQLVVSGQLCFGPNGKLVATGQLGGNVFSVGGPQTFSAGTNTGTGAITATISDVSALAPASSRIFAARMNASERAGS